MGFYYAGNEYLFVDCEKTRESQEDKGELRAKVFRQYSDEEKLINQLSQEEIEFLYEGPEARNL
eukprot:1626640-Prorocentrum_lima.AAC.1